MVFKANWMTDLIFPASVELWLTSDNDWLPAKLVTADINCQAIPLEPRM